MRMGGGVLVALLACAGCGAAPNSGATVSGSNHSAMVGGPDASMPGTVPQPMDAEVRDLGQGIHQRPTTVGSMDGGDAATAAPSWSRIYSQLFVNSSYPSNCAGATCHDPGIQKGIDLSS